MNRSIRNRSNVRRASLLGVMLATSSLLCPTAPAAESAADPAPTQATLRGVGAAGTGVAQPEQWTVVQGLLSNPTDKPQQDRFVFQFPDHPGTQFVRPIWLPPQTSELAQQPARFGEAKGSGNAVDTEALLLPEHAERELGRQTGLIRLVNNSAVAVLEDTTSDGSLNEDDDAVAAISAMREVLGQGRSTYPFQAYGTIRHDAGWTGVGIFLLTADHPAFDAAQTRAVRRWLHAGGKLVVFADQVDPAAMQQLLGEEWGLSLIDRVTLTDIAFRQPAAQAPRTDVTVHPLTAELEVEKPITMARMAAASPQWSTLLSANGWPAILHRRTGRGQVFVITLGGRAWTGLKTEPQKALLTFAARAIAAEQSASITSRVEPEDVVVGPAGDRFVASQLGYRVAGRNIVGPLVGILPAAVLIVGLIGWRTRRLEWVAGTGLVASVGAAAALLVVGQQQRGKVAATAVSLQYVAASDQASVARVQSLTGFYFPRGTKLQLSSEQGGWAWPVSLHRTAGLERMVSEDLDRWRWPSLDIAAAAVRPVQVTTDLTLPAPLHLEWRLGPDGIVGELDWPSDRAFEDPVLVTAQALLRVTAERKGDKIQLRARSEDVLGKGQTLGSGTLSQKQQDRAALVADLARRCRWAEPTLLAWSGPVGTGLKMQPVVAERGESLWSIPVAMKPAESGQSVRVPWPLMSMVPVRDTQRKLGLTMLPLYRADQQAWIDQVANPSAFIGRFMLPEGAAGMKVTGAKLHLDLTAIGRPVRVLGIKAGKLTTITTIQSPDGPRVIDLPADQLEVGPEGGILLAFDVANPADFNPAVVQNSSMWSVHRFGLEVTGKIQTSRK